MHKKTSIFMAIVFSVVYCGFVKGNTPPKEKITLQGQVTDRKTGQPIFGAEIYFPKLKIGATTDFKGRYKIDGLPPNTLLVRVNAIGYKKRVMEIDLSTIQNKNFQLVSKIVERQLDEVIVTGVSKSTAKKRMPAPVSILSAREIRATIATNIIDAITKVPGVSEVSTGPGISKPIIRGLGYNRVVVINNGVRQEGQQWGGEHGIEIDQFSVDHVEVLKGPASLIYGSDALAGVINMLPPPALPEGEIKGGVLLNYQTNNGLFGGSVNLRGNQNGFIWNLRYSDLRAHDYRNKYDGYVFNSGYKKNNIGATIGLNKSWGYSHLHFSAYNFTPGIVEGERDKETGKFIKSVAINDTTIGKKIATRGDFLSYDPTANVPYQKVHHYKTVWNNNFVLGDGNLKVILGWQLNKRQEYEEVLHPKEYGLSFNLNTWTYDFRYLFPKKNNWDFSVGVNGMYQNSQNKGTEFLIPNYNLFEIGTFAIVTKTWNKWSWSGGLRYDFRKENGEALWLNAKGEKVEDTIAGAYRQFSAFHSLSNSIVGSVGATFRINKILNTKLNFSRGFRAPNIAELSANGVHEGTSQYMLGNSFLQPENSWQIDYTLSLNSEHVSAVANLFYNYIDNYIYYRALNNGKGGDSLTNGYRTYQYTSGKAQLFGGEITIDIHPHPIHWLHFENSFSYVHSVQLDQPDSMKFLPFTPAPKWSSELKATTKELFKFLKRPYIKVGIAHYFAQHHFFAAFGTETATPAYTLLNLGIGTEVVSASGKTLFSLYVNVENLLNIAYQSHLSRLKYLERNQATGRKGVFNMGRNISFKIIVPILVRSSQRSRKQ